VELELRADHDHGATRVVDALAEQVLAEPALLALEHVAQALEPMVAGAGDGAPAATVVDQRVARFLQHPLLVADDNLRRLQVEEPREPVVAVDDAPVQVVEVGGREAAAVELDHRSQVGWNDRQGAADHPLRARAALAERLDQAQPLDRLLPALAGGLAHLDVELLGQVVEVQLLDDLLDRLGAHAGVEEPAVPLAERAELALGQGLHDLDPVDLLPLGAGPQACLIGFTRHLRALGSKGIVDAAGEVGDRGVALLGGLRLGILDLGVESGDLGLHGLAQRGQRVLGCLAGAGDHLARWLEDHVLGDGLATRLDARLDPLGCGRQLLAARREALVVSTDVGLVASLNLRLLVGDGALELGPLVLDHRLGASDARVHLLLDALQRLLALVLVDARDDIQSEVKYPLQVAGADVEQDAQARRRALEVPDVAHRGGELDVAHPLAAHLGTGDLHSTLVADDPLVADALVLPAVALPVLGGTKDALVEETVLLRLERAVVDRLRLGDLARGPALD